MFLSKLDIRLVISVVIKCVKLNEMNVHMKNSKIKKTASALVWVDQPQWNNGNNVWQD